MKKIIEIALIVTASFISCKSTAQIKLPKGFVCFKDDDDWTVGCHQLFRKGEIKFISYGCDRGEYGDNTSQAEMINIGLEFCFGNDFYKKTKDGLYVGTGKYKERGSLIYYYKVFIPEKLHRITVLSKTNTKEFSDMSIFILEHIRKHRNDKQFHLVTSNGQTCYFYHD